MSTPTTFFRWRPHPWHGLEAGPNPPRIVNAFIEITAYDLIKYEVDKVTGYLRVDRPQQTSSHPPTLYGFVPQTYCGPRVGKLNPKTTDGDGDPLDICVLSERPITRSEIILSAQVVGALRSIDGGLADDKILAVLQNDNVWGEVNDVSQLPERIVQRLRHYFSTYKLIPGQTTRVSVEGLAGAQEAMEIVEAAMADYEDAFGQR